MRAQRFALEVPVRYRPVGDPLWREGQTENISHTGVLFRAEELLQVDLPIELRVALPVDTAERSRSEVFCHARVVRTVPPAPADARPRLAVSLEDYEFIRLPKATIPRV